jgi:hypothetical protein
MVTGPFTLAASLSMTRPRRRSHRSCTLLAADRALPPSTRVTRCTGRQCLPAAPSGPLAECFAGYRSYSKLFAEWAQVGRGRALHGERRRRSGFRSADGHDLDHAPRRPGRRTRHPLPGPESRGPRRRRPLPPLSRWSLRQRRHVESPQLCSALLEAYCSGGTPGGRCRHRRRFEGLWSATRSQEMDVVSGRG